ncbi:Cyclic di-GMP phosphodiesterase response regulator RpfG [Botrimarina colliarenosi]|uniref:Cyclic di-GMP phosphodiesterase response regulator RpfG n=1 Tax=Botrimarina colliarenosi TaxID=2528001 RepID=A0A5C6AK42_9BACT|nr:HD domain-containing phosphohydrolase [Botrimarina colliarenosi]TWT99780.1 Cyclic di-GMP phosphodiesterase response regulator RpfG [Botrimarina colliarenosi]
MATAQLSNRPLPTDGPCDTLVGRLEQAFGQSFAVLNTAHSAIDAKDRYTCGHSDRVARIAVRLAQEMGCEGEALNALYVGGLLHDIGKIGVDDAVLRKSGALTADEYDQIKLHPTLGEQILHGVPGLEPVLPIVRHHHESWDGSGYPDGLALEEIPALARIAAIADAIDAMGSDRPYRKGMPLEDVESTLREGAGKQWDPAVVASYFAARDDIRAIGRVEREPMALDVGHWRLGEACPLD